MISQTEIPNRGGTSSQNSKTTPILGEMLGNKSINGEIIQQYINKMSIDYKEIFNTERNWDSVLVNLQILEILIQSNADIPTVKDFVSVIFRVFIGLNDGETKSVIELSDILSYKLKSDDSGIVNAYLQLKTNLLRIYSMEEKIPFSDIADNYEYNSNFYAFFVGSSISTNLAYSLTSSFLKLSVSTKTTFRLSFLILATHYSIFTDNFKIELLDKINKDATKMLLKSDKLVYKFTAKHLYSLAQLCKLKNIRSPCLDSILERYNKINPTYSENLLKSLDGMNISEDVMTLINNHDCSQLVQSKTFVKKLSSYIKTLDLTSTINLQNLDKIIAFIISDKQNIDFLTNSIDYITVKFKDIKCVPDNITFVYDGLTKLSAYLFSMGQIKRLGNFQRLLFHFGSISLEIDPVTSLSFWTAFIKFDNKLSTTWDVKLLTLRRLVFVSNDQILKSNFHIASIIQLIFLNNVSSGDKYPHEYESLLQNELLTSIKIISKCITSEGNCCNFLFRYIESESLITSIVLEIVNCIDCSNIPDKDSLIGQIIISQKEQLKDTGLFLYFLSKISTVVDFPINFRNSALSFNDDSIILNYEHLVVSHLYTLQSFSNTQDNSELIIKGYNSITKWIQDIQVDFTPYEFEVIKSVYYTLKYHNFYELCLIMLRSYLGKRMGVLEKKETSLVLSFIFNSLVKLQNFQFCEDLVTQYRQYCGMGKISTYEEMNVSLDLLHYYIVTNSEAAANQIKRIHEAFSTNDQFTIEKQGDKYQAVELLMLHSRFCKISGIYNISDHLNSITNLNRSISLLQSIFKNFLLLNPKAPSLNGNFKSVLKMRFSYEMLSCYILLLDQYSIIGFGKEYDHFMKELETFVKIQPSVNLQYLINLKLVDLNIFRGSVNAASEFMNIVDTIQSVVYDDGNKTTIISGLMTRENYARALGDEELVHLTSQKLDRKIIEYMAENINKHLVEQWTVVLRRRYEKFYSSDNMLTTSHTINNFIVESYKLLNETKESTNNTISCYPTRDDLTAKSVNEKVEKLKGLNSKIIENLRSNFEVASVDMSKSNMDMIINCFVDIVNSDNSVKVKNELSQIVSLNDQYKRYPFFFEKQFALNDQRQRSVLPEISTTSGSTVVSTSTVNFKNLLPADWQVLSIDYVFPTNSLVIVRYDSKYSEPLFVNISLKDKSDQYSFKNIIDSLNQIIEESDKTTSAEVTQKIKTYDEKSQWWDTRKSLDKRLEELLASIDVEWFGGFNSLFQSSGVSSGDIANFKIVLSDLISQYVNANKIESIRANMMRINDGIYELFLKIDRITIEKVTDMLLFFFETMGLKDTVMFKESDILDMAKKLKDTIVSLTKKKIIDDASKNHIVLVLGSTCSKLPWESIPSLRTKSVTRMPTLSQLGNYLVKYKNLLDNGIDPCKGYYIINPGGDLQRTEVNLGPRFKELDGWNGLVGKPPSDADIIKAFDEANLYIYAGHGGGEQYIKSKNIKKRDCIPPSLLLGCSSGSLKGNGSIHQYGTAYNYINGGCPMLLVNLWDVTDKDIDLFTVDALTKWGFFVDYDSFDPFDMTMENPTLSQCVAKSKDVCKLKYLNGAAPIIYGLPLRLETM